MNQIIQDMMFWFAKFVTVSVALLLLARWAARRGSAAPSASEAGASGQRSQGTAEKG